MSERILMDASAIARTLVRLSHEVVEKNKGTENLCLIGIRRRGEIVANRICALIEKFYGVKAPCAGIDIGMYRDDLISGFFVPEATANRLGFTVAGKNIVLCDDVLHTGRSVRAAIEAIFDLGRPAKVMLLNDEDFSAAARVEAKGVEGLASGNGSNGVNLKYLPLESAVEKGDKVYTSSSGALFPDGILIGEIRKTGYESKRSYDTSITSKLRPIIDGGSVKEVFVMPALRRGSEGKDA